MSWVCTLHIFFSVSAGTVPITSRSRRMSRSRRNDVFCFAGSEHEHCVLGGWPPCTASVHLCLRIQRRRATSSLCGFVDDEQRQTFSLWPCGVWTIITHCYHARSCRGDLEESETTGFQSLLQQQDEQLKPVISVHLKNRLEFSVDIQDISDILD